jgi:formate hydrogenlyase subunit 4
LNELLEYSGSLLAIFGAIAVARNDNYSKWGFVVFLISNVFLGTWSYIVEAWGLLALNAVYTGINIYGINKWFFERESQSTL